MSGNVKYRILILLLSVLFAFQIWMADSGSARRSQRQQKRPLALTALKSWSTALPMVETGDVRGLDSFHSPFLLLVVFSSKDCFACLEALPLFADFGRRYGEETVQVVAVAQAPTRRYLAYLLNKYRVDFPVLFDSTQVLARENDLRNVPVALLFNKRREVIMQGWPNLGSSRYKDFILDADSIISSQIM